MTFYADSQADLIASIDAALETHAPWVRTSASLDFYLFAVEVEFSELNLVIDVTYHPEVARECYKNDDLHADLRRGTHSRITQIYTTFDRHVAEYNDIDSSIGVSVPEKRIAGVTLNVASFIASGVRRQARAEWASEQVAAQGGEVSSVFGRVLFSMGLIRAAVLIRASRVCEPGIDLLDRIVRSETRTRQAIAVVVFGAAFYVFKVQGLASVIGDGESLLEGGAALYGAARWRRKVLKDRDEISGADADTEAPPDPPG